MFGKLYNRVPKSIVLKRAARKFSTSKSVYYKVCVAGASGGVGQPLCLLLKLSPLITNLHLYDIDKANGVAADLAHCETPGNVMGFNGKSKISQAFRGISL